MSGSPAGLLDLSGVETVADQDFLREVQEDYPDVSFELAEWNHPDNCSFCPAGPWDTPDTIAVVHFSWGGVPRIERVGVCCLKVALDYLADKEAVNALLVQVLYLTKL